MKKNLLVMVCYLLFLCSGCNLSTVAASRQDNSYAICDVNELKTGKVYVWNPAGSESIYEDIAKVNKEPVFFRAGLGDYNFAGSEITETYEYPRTIWMNAENDEKIRTVTSRDLLLYVSDTQVPQSFVFERFGDYGYTIGVANLVPDGGGHYYLPYAENDADDYKYYLNMSSDASQLAQFPTITRLYLDKVGDIEVNKESVSKGGTVNGLKKGEGYVCEFYTGTYYQDFYLVADIHTFCSMEKFVSYEYEFLHSNCIKIAIPKYCKSGLYMINGVGFFRYIADEDLELFDEGRMDEIDFNDPVVIYDEYGFVIYDPSVDEWKEEE